MLKCFLCRYTIYSILLYCTARLYNTINNSVSDNSVLIIHPLTVSIHETNAAPIYWTTPLDVCVPMPLCQYQSFVLVSLLFLSRSLSHTYTHTHLPSSPCPGIDWIAHYPWRKRWFVVGWSRDPPPIPLSHRETERHCCVLDIQYIRVFNYSFICVYFA